MKKKSYLLLSLGLVGFHVSVYGILPALGLSRQEVLAQVGLLPADFWNFSQPLALFTSLFLFQDWAGVLAAVFLLSSLLRFLEQELGSRHFLLLFFITGFLGGVPLLWIWPNSYEIYATGSAGIFGLLAILSVFYSKGKIRILFWKWPFGVALAFGWAIALMFLFPWESIGNEGSSAGAWSIPIFGVLAALLYARLAFVLPIGGRLSFEPSLWYLAVEHPKRRHEGDYFKELQQMQTPSAQNQAKEDEVSQRAAGGLQQTTANANEGQNWQASPIEELASPSLQNPNVQGSLSKHENPQTDPAVPESQEIQMPRKPPSASFPKPPAPPKVAFPHKRLIYDPKTGRFILTEED